MKKYKWILIFFTLILGVTTIFSFATHSKEVLATESTYGIKQALNSYEEYIQLNSTTGAEGVVEAYVEEAIKYESGKGVARLPVEVPVAGYYRITVEYAQTKNTLRDIRVGIMINDNIPFAEADDIFIPSIYEDDGEIRVDLVGNEIAPKQKAVLDWQKHTLCNSTGFYTDDYLFYFDKGKSIISLEGKGGEFIINGLVLSPKKVVPSYKEYLDIQASTHNINSSEINSSGIIVKKQAELSKYKTGSVLYPVYDRNSAATEDSHNNNNSPKYIRINSMGGNMWKTPGQWISWDIDVPKDGFYEFGLKFKQNFLDGLFTSRDIYIDGDIPFEEFKAVKFKYDDQWQVMNISNDEGEPYKVYLEKGVHEVKLLCTMGEFTNSLRRLNNSVYEINDLYRQIIMITSTKPDTYTDYFLKDKIPNLIEILERNEQILKEEIDNITSISGGKGSKLAPLDTLCIQLRLFAEDTEEIPLRLSSFKNNISALGSWIVTIQEQALLLDYFYIKTADVNVPRAEHGLLNNIMFSIERFISSFNRSKELVDQETSDSSPSVKVWLDSSIGADGSSAGRDQTQVLKDLIDESFTPETGIVVELELVQGSLLQATLAGTGPDVALMQKEDQPVNFAIRHALQDLTEFDDFDEVAELFYESALAPFWYLDGCYAIPDTQVFNMLFYRTDVFDTLEISVPETWDEFYEILPVIQRSNLQITVQDIFPTLLFQNDGSYYSQDGTKALFDQQIAIDAMKTYTDLYTSYGFEVKTDFYSRFRSGELIMSIQPYSMYNQLSAAAPEIAGLWAMADIPGTIKNEHINKKQNGLVTGSIMLDSAKDKEAAWEFMKWWSRDDVKAKYGIALESIMGPASRFTPANIGTLSLLPWSEEEFNALEEARRNVVGIPQLPGSYYTSRAIINAFRSIVYTGEFPRSAMVKQNKFINEEITRKRLEFGLSIDEDNR